MDVNTPAERHCPDLIRRAQTGDLAAFDELAQAERGRLLALVRGRLLDARGDGAIDAEEVVQETLVRALQAIERFECRGPDAFFQWLVGIARRVILAARRKRRHARLDSATEVPGADVSPSRELAREERLERLRDAIAVLDEPHREVILLARIEGLTIAEVSERMGRTPGAVKQLLSRALRKLRGAFGTTDSFSLPRPPLSGDGGAC